MKFKPTITGEWLYNNHPDTPNDWKKLPKKVKASWNELAAETCQQIALDLHTIFQ